MSTSDRLNTPGRERRWLPRVRMDSEVFGSFAEGFARFMGTASFLLWMSVIIIAWLVWNTFGPELLHFDPYPWLFLTLVLSLQASYAAPLILLAQNRQEARERVSIEHDREVAAQARADTDFLAREIASMRMRIGDLATRDFIRSELRDLLEELGRDDDDVHAGDASEPKAGR